MVSSIRSMMCRGRLIVMCALLSIFLVQCLPISPEGSTPTNPTSKDVKDGYKLVKLKEKDALCLDGTKGGYYIRQRLPDKWIVHLEGGGWCLDEQDCLARSKTDLGSSKAWKSTGIPGMDGGDHGMFNIDPKINPDFWNYTMVFVCYCDGASFAGNVTDPILVNGTLIYFKGRSVLDRTIQSLLASGMSGASEVLIKGGSAGGLAVYMHLDHIREMIPLSVQVKGLADGGFFLDSPTWQGKPLYTPRYQKISKMQNVLSNAACQDYLDGDRAWMCFMAPYVSVFIDTPIYIINSMYDTWQLKNILNLTCIDDLTKCEGAELVSLQSQRGAMLTNIRAILQMKGGMTGGFLWACPVHTITGNDNMWPNGSAGGTGMSDAFASWYFGRGLPNWTIDCAWPCNKECPVA